MRETAEQFRRCLSDLKNPLWFPGLAESLVAIVPDSISVDYSTSKFVANVEPQLIFNLQSSAKNNDPGLRIEVLSKKVETEFVSRGLDFLSCDAVGQPDIGNLLRDAIKIIQVSPSLATSIQVLAKSIHLLKQEDSSTDISFSDPSIPFSIFVSVCPNAECASFRLAEALIHEAMHLQLTLIEKMAELWRDEGATFFSPWKGAERPTSGLLHALYVFGVIDEWLKTLVEAGHGEQYVQRRRIEIASEVELVDIKAIEFGLAKDGKLLLARIVG
jgi:hypothetical protein